MRVRGRGLAGDREGGGGDKEREVGENPLPTSRLVILRTLTAGSA